MQNAVLKPPPKQTDSLSNNDNDFKVQLHPAPSLLPTDRKSCYQKGYADAERLYRNDDAIAEDKYLLGLLRQRVNEIRKERGLE